MNAQDVALAAQRGILTLAADPAMAHYSSDTLALVYRRTVLNLSGAGDLLKAAERMADDPELIGVPLDVVKAIMAASFSHFARALPPSADEAGLSPSAASAEAES